MGLRLIDRTIGRERTNMGALTVLLGLLVPSLILVVLDAYIQKRGQ